MPIMPARAALVRHAVTGRFASVKPKVELARHGQPVAARAQHPAIPAISAILARHRAAAKSRDRSGKAARVAQHLAEIRRQAMA